MQHEAPAHEQVPAPPVAGAAGTEEADIGRKVMRGTAWVAASRWGTMLVSWPTTIVLARLLDPADYGYLALVTVFTRFGRIVAEAGVSGTVVLGPVLTEQQYARLHGLSTAMFVVVGLVLAGLATPIEAYYGSEGLRWVLLALTTTFLAEGWMVVPIARMRRAVRFKELAGAESARVIADAAIALLLALNGFRYWALVGGYVGGISLQALLIHRTARMRPTRPGVAGIEDAVASARRLLVGSLATFTATSSDAWVGASVVGASGLGGYSYMNGLARSPVEKLAGLVTYAGSALLGNMHGDAQRIVHATLRLARLTMLLMTPVFVGIALVAEPLVRGLLGAKWLSFVPALQVLSLFAASYPLTSSLEQAVVALGHTRTSALNGLIMLLMLPLSFFLLGRALGATGLALAWLVPLPFTLGRLVLTIRREWNLSLGVLFRELYFPIAASAVMAIVVGVLRSPIRSVASHPLVELALLAASGASVYALFCGWLARDDLRWLMERARTR